MTRLWLSPTATTPTQTDREKTQILLLVDGVLLSNKLSGKQPGDCHGQVQERAMPWAEAAPSPKPAGLGSAGRGGKPANVAVTL